MQLSVNLFCLTIQDENRKLLEDLQGANKDCGYFKEALAAATASREELISQVQLLEVGTWSNVCFTFNTHAY